MGRTSIPALLRKALARAPVDQVGVLGPLCGPPQTRRLHQIISRYFWQRVPPWARLLLCPVARVAWFLLCPWLAWRTIPRPLTAAGMRQGAARTLAGWGYGLHPAATPLSLSPDFPAVSERQLAAFWVAVGGAADSALARDKLALAEKMAALGVPVPITRAVLHPSVTTPLLPWPWAQPVFAKYQSASRAINALALWPGPEPKTLWMTTSRTPKAQLISTAVAVAHLHRMAETGGPVLIQDFLHPAEALRPPFPDCTPELRLTTARLPGGPARVIAAFAKIQPPGAYTATSLSGALVIPLEPQEGRMTAGQFFQSPKGRHPMVPWSGTPLPGRLLPGYAPAVVMVERAATLLPSLAVIGWDVLLTATGPVVLEANTHLSWSMIHLWANDTASPSPLLPFLPAWLDAAEGKG